MKHMYRWVIAGLVAAAVPVGAASAGNLDAMPKGDWVKKLNAVEMKDLRGAGFGIAFDIAISGSIENISDLIGTPGLTSPPPGFDLSVSNGIASVTTAIGGINGNGIFVFNQIPGNFNVVNTNVIVNVAINGFQ